MGNFIVRNKKHNVKDYLLTLIVDDMRLFLAVEQGSGKTSDSLLVIVAPKAKGEAKKWMSIACGKEVKVKYKVEYLTTFLPFDLPVKTECTEDLENFLAQEMQEIGVMKMNNLKKRHNYIKNRVETSKQEETREN